MKKLLLILGAVFCLTLTGCEETSSSSDPGRCRATTQKGTQCKRNAESGSIYCWQHKK